ncbi:hypothetical protein [Natronomonas marina]|uniref:hypothetical protein n=1 Tax=Natronomonas marina TaxID=2961939 RepID=UPI0020C961E3|nr:hypothetical protein [Natronomonas marina]
MAIGLAASAVLVGWVVFTGGASMGRDVVNIGVSLPAYPMLVAGLLAGLAYPEWSTKALSLWTGLGASLGVAFVVVRNGIDAGLTVDSTVRIGAVVAGTIVAIPLSVGLTVLVTALGVAVGRRLGSKGRSMIRSSGTG